MANTRIKDLSNTATNVASDAFIAIDGSANGTEKISRDNLRQDTADALAAAPSTYNLAPLTSGSVDVDKGGTGSTTVAGAKTNLEIPTLGTAANQVPLNGMLGSMAYQDSAAPSVGTLHSDGLARMSNTGGDVALWAESTGSNVMIVNVIGASPNYIFDVRDDDVSKFRIDGNGNVVIGSIPTSATGLASGTIWSDSGTLKIV